MVTLEEDIQKALSKYKIVISLDDMRLLLTNDGKVSRFPITCSQFGFGGQPYSNKTPYGLFRIHEKIGDDVPDYGIIYTLVFYGRIGKPSSDMQNSMVTRILRIDGLDEENKWTLDRNIYIHGTLNENFLGQRISFGCIGLKTADIKKVYVAVNVDDRIYIHPPKEIVEEILNQQKL